MTKLNWARRSECDCFACRMAMMEPKQLMTPADDRRLQLAATGRIRNSERELNDGRA